MKKILSLLSLCSAFAVVAPAYAAEASSANTNAQIFMDKVKADKKLIVAANLNLTDAEAKAFWPVYDSYQKELAGLNEQASKLIQSFADSYNAKNLTDDGAKKLIDQQLSLDEAELRLRKTYAGKVAKVLPGIKAARYQQVENKIRAAMRYQVAAAVPLAE